MSPVAKTIQLQIRVSRDQKEAIARAAKRAGLGMSAYVLGRVLGAPRHRVAATSSSTPRWAGVCDRPAHIAGHTAPLPAASDVASYDEPVALITRYYPLERFPRKTLDALEDLLERKP